MPTESSTQRFPPEAVATRVRRGRHPFIISILVSPTLIASLVFLVSLLVIAACSYRDPNVYDEGVAVYGAERVLQGDVPYRDFWTLYAPAHLYLLAGLFKVFGTQLVVERHAWVLVQAGIGLLIYLIARRLAGVAWALVAWAIAVIWLTRVPLFGAPIRPALLLCLGALLAALLANEAPRRRALRLAALAGALTGLCALFRQDIGFYGVVMIGSTLVLARARPPAASTRPAIGLPPVVAFLGAAAVVLLPALLALFAAVPASALVDQLVTFPIFVYPRIRALPLPEWPASPLGLLCGDVTAFDYFKASARGWQWYPAVLLLTGTTIGSLAAILRSARGASRGVARPREIGVSPNPRIARLASVRRLTLVSRAPDTRAWFAHALFLVAGTGVLMLNYARVQSDIFHLLPALLFALIVGVSLIARTSRLRARWPHTLLLAGAVLALTGIVLLTVQTERKIRARQSPLDTPRAAGMTTPHRSHTYEQLIAYIQRTVPPTAAIFVGSQQHDAIGINDVLLYFLANRRSATRYHELHPGVATTAPVQAEIIRDLDAQQVSCVILRDEERPAVQPEEARSELTGATLLDRYIAEHFTPGPRFDNYQVWTRGPEATGGER